jgi:DNA repair protein SbcD/Mre11
MEGNMGESKIVYPGPIFGSTFEDLEQTAKGERRGFYIITFDKKLTGYEFIEIKVADIISRELQADGMSPSELDRTLTETISSIEVKDKIILIKLVGSLHGRRSDIDFGKFSANLHARGALVPILNINNLTTLNDTGNLEVRGTTRVEIESSIFKECISKFKTDTNISVVAKEKMAMLCEDSEMALKLLETFKMEKIENETAGIYDERISTLAKSVLRLTEY